MNTDKDGRNPPEDSVKPRAVQQAATGPLLVSFSAGAFGAWRIERITPVIGEGLATAPRLQVVEGRNSPNEPPPVWALRGTTSTRYNRAGRGGSAGCTAGGSWAHFGNAGRAHTHQKDRGVVGDGSGRKEGYFRRAIPTHRHWAALPAGYRETI